jgi:hypothetical protein
VVWDRDQEVNTPLLPRHLQEDQFMDATGKIGLWDYLWRIKRVDTADYET